jgi:hypothetical protein
MALVDDAAAGPPSGYQRTTKIDAWLASLGDEDRAAALAVLADPQWNHEQARAMFGKHGLAISACHFSRLRRERYGFAC